MHATLGVAPRIDARDMSAWRHGQRPAIGARNLHPGIVERRVLRVVVRLDLAPLLHVLRGEIGQWVDDGEAVAHALAVRDHRQLHRFDAIAIQQLGLIRRHDIRAGHHRHIFGDLQPFQSGALGHVADDLWRPHLRQRAGGGGLQHIRAGLWRALGDGAVGLLARR